MERGKCDLVQRALLLGVEWSECDVCLSPTVILLIDELINEFIFKY